MGKTQTAQTQREKRAEGTQNGKGCGQYGSVELKESISPFNF